ncbi:MAG: DUF4328 domain-containing protein [Actinomycetota bacterium]|nr:DUF4328 domain-containing protein [Actinomycetota bacterium]
MEHDVSTEVFGERVRPQHPAPARPYCSLTRLSNVVIALLTVHVVFDVAAAIVDVQMLGLLERIRDGGPVTFEEATAHDSRMFWSGILQSIGAATVGIPFIVWLRRAYRNLGPLGTRWLRFKPGWAVAGWFVPFLWFARPKSIVNDVWRASDPELPREIFRPPDGAPVPGAINWWWGLSVAGYWLYPVDWGRGLPPTVDEMSVDVQRILVADCLLVVAGILAMLVVRRTALRQETRHARLAAAPAGQPAEV